jgi:tRNA/rRNA methyltransferase
MAGTDSTAAGDPAPDAPAVILVEPQLGENIGMVARAMLNCGLADLRLVRPRDAWPNDRAVAAASGADAVVAAARLFETTADAVADLERVYAATARPRDMAKDQVTPRRAAAEVRGLAETGGRSGFLFGGEAMGLDNDDVALADAILAVPLNPGFRSLNLAQAVFAAAYEWFQAGLADPGREATWPKETRPATKGELLGFFDQLEDALDASGFLHVEEKRPIMVRNLRNIFQRAGLTEQEIRTLRGVVTSLTRYSKD